MKKSGLKRRIHFVCPTDSPKQRNGTIPGLECGIGAFKNSNYTSNID
jgi:hypothetical protein